MKVHLIVLSVALIVLPVSIVHHTAEGAVPLSANVHNRGMSAPVTLDATIGDNQTESRCFLFHNLTVSEGSTLSIRNSVVTFQNPDPALVNHGRVIVFNSTLSMHTQGFSRLLSCGGSNSSMASFIMKNSSLFIDGFVNITNTKFCLWNSTISNGTGHVFPHESIDFTSSIVYLHMSKIQGLAQDNLTHSFSAGSINDSSVPISNPGSVHYTANTTYGGNLMVESMNFSLLVSGNNPYCGNYLDVRLNGVSLAMEQLPNTGSIYSRREYSFDVNLEKLQMNLTSILSGLTLYYNMSTDIRSNSTIWSISAAIMSQDWVDRYGNEFNEVRAVNSTVVSYCSNLGINDYAKSLNCSVPDPQADMLVLRKGSAAYLAGNFYDHHGNSNCLPVLASSSSLAVTLSVINITACSGQTPLNGFNISSTSEALNESQRALGERCLEAGERTFAQYSGSLDIVRNGRGKMLLPNSLISPQEQPVYLGAFNITVAGKTLFFSPTPFPAAHSLQGNLNFSFSLAIPAVSSLDKYMLAHAAGNLSFMIFRNYDRQYSLQAFLSIPLAGVSKACGTQLLTSTQNITFPLKVPGYIDAASVHVYLNLSLSTETPQGSTLHFTFRLPVRNSVSIRLNSSFDPLSGLLNDTICDLSSPSSIPMTLVIENETTGSVLERTNISGTAGCGSRIISLYLGPSTNATVGSLLIVPPDYMDAYPTAVSVMAKNATTYKVSFNEIGLPACTPWAVNQSGSILVSGSPWINVTLPNGSYRFTIPEIHGYDSKAFSCSFRVRGSSLVIPISFMVHRYIVTIMEMGIPAFTSWSAWIGNSLHTANSTMMVISLPEGVYVFSPEISGNYFPSNSSWVITVSGNTTVNVTYRFLHQQFLGGFFDFVTYNYPGVSALLLTLILLVEYWRLRSGFFFTGDRGSKKEK